MAKTDYRVSGLVAKIRQGELQLPEMQRRQLVTFEGSTGVPEQFERFCENRRAALASQINLFLSIQDRL